MGLLDGELAADIAEGLSDIFLDGTVTRHTEIGGGAYSAGTTTTQTHACKVVVETYSDFLRSSAGIPDTDVKIIILRAPLPGFALQPADIVTARGVSYRVIQFQTDPAEATWTAQGRPV